MSITFSSCFYIIKSKFNPSIYVSWMNNLISIVKHFNLVIYTDYNSSKYINTKQNPKIKIVIKPLEHFHNYKYKEFWIKNHNKNILLNGISSWELNMLWSEKIWFVKDTIERKEFETDFYGWCDIGYFRNRADDFHSSQLTNWGNNTNIFNNNINKICYACVNNNNSYMNKLYQIVNNKNNVGLPIKEIPVTTPSIGGGFFFLHKDKIDWWVNTYDTKLQLYFKNNYLVKDDQIILVDCILSNLDKFTLFRENIRNLDNWFMFQRILTH
jgi:hypothetical protein